MDLKNYELSDYEEYLLKRTGTENVSFADGMVYATYHPENNTTELMKTNDDEFVALCIEAEEQMKSLQTNSTDDNSEWLDRIRFPIDSKEIDEFERVFYERHSDIKPQQKNDPLSGSIVTVPLGEALFEFMYADFDSLYDEVKLRLYKRRCLNLCTRILIRCMMRSNLDCTNMKSLNCRMPIAICRTTLTGSYLTARISN